MKYLLLLFISVATAFGASRGVSYDSGNNNVYQVTLNQTFALITNSAATASTPAGYDANKKLISMSTTGTGSLVQGGSPTITTPTVTGGSFVSISLTTPVVLGVIDFPDGVRQTFNPDATLPGLNVGSHAGNPSTPANGDLWYNSTANALNARINGATVALGAGGGGGGGTAGSMINVGANIVGGIPIASDSTDTNYTPSSVTVTLLTNLHAGTLNATNEVTGSSFRGTGVTADSRIDVPDDDGSAYAGFQANNTTTTPVNFIFPAAPFTGIATFGVTSTSNWIPIQATAGTDYSTPTSTDTFQNKTLDAAATGNVLRQTKSINLQRPDYADGIGAVPQTNAFNVSGLMHYTFSGNAETNANYAVYEFDCPPDLDTTVAMTARFAFLSGGTDADDYVFHITYGQVAPGTAYPTGTGIASLPIVMTVTPTTAASGDFQASAATTLTGWAAALTPGRAMTVRIARLQNTQDDGARDVQLVITYGSTL